jgi:hypothetical protein
MTTTSSFNSFQSEGPMLGRNPADASSAGSEPGQEYPVWQAALLDGAVVGA